MGCRVDDIYNITLNITLVVPQISKEVSNPDIYEQNKIYLAREIENIVKALKIANVNISLNPSDNPLKELYYLRYTGSCIESGDEGVVGRGNRIGGIINSRKPYTIEGLNGKNSAYHAGEIYTAAAWEISNEIWNNLGLVSETFIVSQIDRPLNDPWQIIINCSEEKDFNSVKEIANNVLKDIGKITNNLINRRYPLV